VCDGKHEDIHRELRALRDRVLRLELGHDGDGTPGMPGHLRPADPPLRFPGNPGPMPGQEEGNL